MRVGKEIRKRHSPPPSCPGPGEEKETVRAFPTSTGVPEASGDQGFHMPKARGKSLAYQVWENLPVLGHRPGGKGST